jgi:DNA-binding response OmpR family regulator
MRILLVEDDVNLSQDLHKQLVNDGFVVDTCFDGLLAEKMIARNDYQCILLDINIPGKNGLEVCLSIRKKEITIPVIMITSFGELDDKIQGFDCGADDYLAKPFYYKELLARIKVATKRNQGTENRITDKFMLADLVLDYHKKKVFRSGVEIKLTLREFELLKALAIANGNPVSKQYLLENIWGTTYGVNTNTIEVFINFIRNKIDKEHTVKLIKTKVGFGYYLAADEFS